MRISNMNRYIVKQITFNKEEQEYPNLYGWDGATSRSKKWFAKMELMHGNVGESFKANPAFIALFNDKYEVEARDLNHVFEITNLWETPDAVHTFEPGHSTSVGDLIEDTQTGQIFIVAKFGFTEVVPARTPCNFEVA